MRHFCQAVSVEPSAESPTTPSSATPTIQRIFLEEESVKVNDKGEIVERSPITVDAFIEDLGNGVTFTMVRVPAGRFEMGQTEEEKHELTQQVGEDNYKAWFEDELPGHNVNVPSFFMGMVTVTQEVYERIMGENPATESDRDRFVAPKKPIINVSWNDAIAFCQKLSERTGNEYRLPSEAEWEYACRAGTTTPFHFGPTLTTAIANYSGNYTYGNGPKGDYRSQTTPVGSFPPNAFGLYEMHGNVWEWCADHWHDNYDGAPNDGSAWVRGGDSTRRVLRGGSWSYIPRYCRSAVRNRNSADLRDNLIGFRLVCSSPRTT